MSWTPTPLYAFVAERANTRGDAQALVTTTARLNYRDQHAAVRRAAKAMYALGVRRGDFIGILMGNSETWVTLFYAAAAIGAVTVPINTALRGIQLGHILPERRRQPLVVDANDELRVQRRGLAVAGRETWIRVNRPRFRAPVAGRCARSNRILLLKLGADQHVPAAVVAEGHAEAERGVHVLAVAFGRLAVIELCFEPLEVFVQDHIDDARNCIRAVSSRSTAGDDLHALDEHRRDQRQIDCAAFGVRHDAARVDER